MKYFIIVIFSLFLLGCSSVKTLQPLTGNVTELKYLLRFYYQIEESVEEAELESLRRYIDLKIYSMAALSRYDNYIAPFAGDAYCRIVMNSERVPVAENYSAAEIRESLLLIARNSMQSLRAIESRSCEDLFTTVLSD
jgi:hypothetical protein